MPLLTYVASILIYLPSVITVTFYLHASNIKMAVAVIFPGDLFQQPVIPVQKAAKTAIKDIINNAMRERPISGSKTIDN